MQWIITKDHIDTDQQGFGTALAIGSKMTCVHPFRIYDGDDVLYYEGVSDDNLSESAFAPLDWATAYAGATRIDYLRNGKWETL